MSSAKVRVGGKAASSEAKPRLMFSSELGSSATVVRSDADWAAKDRKNALKLTISSPSCCSWTFSAAVTLPMAATSFERSWGSVPVTAWLITAAPRSEAGPRW